MEVYTNLFNNLEHILVNLPCSVLVLFNLQLSIRMRSKAVLFFYVLAITLGNLPGFQAKGHKQMHFFFM